MADSGSLFQQAALTRFRLVRVSAQFEDIPRVEDSQLDLSLQLAYAFEYRDSVADEVPRRELRVTCNAELKCDSELPEGATLFLKARYEGRYNMSAPSDGSPPDGDQRYFIAQLMPLMYTKLNQLMVQANVVGIDFEKVPINVFVPDALE